MSNDDEQKEDQKSEEHDEAHEAEHKRFCSELSKLVGASQGRGLGGLCIANEAMAMAASAFIFNSHSKEEFLAECARLYDHISEEAEEEDPALRN